MQEEIIKFYSRPQFGGGGVGVVFAGSRRQQVGGGFFGSLARFALPILKSVGSRILGVAARTASDVIQDGRPLKQALLNNTLEEVQSVFRNRSSTPSATTPINKNDASGSAATNLEGRGYYESDIINDVFSNSSSSRKRQRKQPISTIHQTKKRRRQGRYYATPLRKK